MHTQLHTESSNVVQLPLCENQTNNQVDTRKGWSYLMSNSLAFQKNVNHAIRIQKPTEEKVPEWICKLITSGQCRTIYVEDLQLPVKEKVIIEHLCQQYSVALINLNTNDVVNNNVVHGPW